MRNPMGIPPCPLPGSTSSHCTFLASLLNGQERTHKAFRRFNIGWDARISLAALSEAGAMDAACQCYNADSGSTHRCNIGVGAWVLRH